MVLPNRPPPATPTVSVVVNKGRPHPLLVLPPKVEAPAAPKVGRAAPNVFVDCCAVLPNPPSIQLGSPDISILTHRTQYWWYFHRQTDPRLYFAVAVVRIRRYWYSAVQTLYRHQSSISSDIFNEVGPPDLSTRDERTIIPTPPKSKSRYSSFHPQHFHLRSAQSASSMLG